MRLEADKTLGSFFFGQFQPTPQGGAPARVISPTGMIPQENDTAKKTSEPKQTFSQISGIYVSLSCSAHLVIQPSLPVPGPV
jgi:hypothetical protein